MRTRLLALFGLLVVLAGFVAWPGITRLSRDQFLSERTDVPPALSLQDSANSTYIGSPTCAVKVTSGDTLGAIAAHYHTTYQQLAAWNRISNPNLIFIGECLRVSASAPSVAPTAVVAPTGRVKAAGWRNLYVDKYGNPNGQCTWYAAQMAVDDLNGLHNAWQWPAYARAKGIPTGSTPRVGAVVVFAPGVQGAGGIGHVAIVTAMLTGGKFQIREMNRTGVPSLDGSPGGPGKVDDWTAWAASGVSFIY